MSDNECPDCGRTFGTQRGLSLHQTNAHKPAWSDEDTLREMAHERRMSSREIADELGCSADTVLDWMDKFGIQPYESIHVGVREHPHGYRQIHHYHDGEQHVCFVHRLAAVAKYGIDEVCEKEVHHKNGVRWDNSPSNLTLMTTTEHRRHHWTVDNPRQ